MPQQRKLTDAQEDEALNAFRAGNGKHGTTAELARVYGLSFNGMKDCLFRAAEREAMRGTEIEVSREPAISPGGQA